MNALILVDLQYDFIPGGALAVPDGGAVIPIANRVQPKFDCIVATQDWHPQNHGSFAANHPGSNIGDIVDLNGLDQILWPLHCVQNTRGAALIDELDRSRIDRIVQKGTQPGIDSYSGFFDNGRKQSTGLGEYLQEKNVNRVYIMGLATDYCVKFTVLDAISLGFETFLIEDGCRGVDLSPGDVQAATEQMIKNGVRVVRSDDLHLHA